jgi:PAS domain-containing protein
MDPRESLTVRTVSALQRLADLEERGKTVNGARAGVLKTALRELEASLEELRTASEQLNHAMDEVAGVKMSSARFEAQLVEFREALPLPCVLTDARGTIAEANARAGDLLNVAPRHLAGKPLSLYMVNRDEFFTLMNGLKFGDHSPAASLQIRPRERKPRVMATTVTRLREAERLCWFFQEPPPAAQAG